MKARTETYLYARDDDGTRTIWTKDSIIKKFNTGFWGANDKADIIAIDNDPLAHDYCPTTDLIGTGMHGLRKGRKTLITVTHTVETHQ